MSAITAERCRGLTRTLREPLERALRARWTALLNLRIRIGHQQDEPVTVSVRDILGETPFLLLAAGFMAMLILL